MNFIFLSLFFYSSYSFSIPIQEFKCNDEKDLPKETVGCQGEACEFVHYNRALNDISLYERPSLTSKKVAIVKRCEELKNLRPIMITKSYGKAKITKSTPELKKQGVKIGDIVPIQQYGGEGYLSLCINQKRDIQAVMDELGNTDHQIANIKVIKNTKIDSWIKLSSQDGVDGYAPRSANTVMWYATIDEAKLCDPSHKKLLKNF